MVLVFRTSLEGLQRNNFLPRHISCPLCWSEGFPTEQGYLWLRWGAFLSSFWGWISDLLVLPFFHIPGSPVHGLGPLLPVWHAHACESSLWSLSSCLFTCSLVPEIDFLSLPIAKMASSKSLQSHWSSPRHQSWTSHPVPEVWCSWYPFDLFCWLLHFVFCYI